MGTVVRLTLDDKHIHFRTANTLSPALKTQMVALMNAYFDDLKVNGYQAQDFSSGADGNFFGGHLYGVAMMGYARRD